jgi:hypothetical protein
LHDPSYNLFSLAFEETLIEISQSQKVYIYTKIYFELVNQHPESVVNRSYSHGIHTFVAISRSILVGVDPCLEDISTILYNTAIYFEKEIDLF